jgi:hypothetical protein
VVHKLPVDLRNALIANHTALDAWNDGPAGPTGEPMRNGGGAGLMTVRQVL